tara:strand:- start:32 stop:361 length:330 start_codon:yes stop_codon:yes gene_type:complete
LKIASARTISSSSNPVNTTVNTPPFRRPIIAMLALMMMMLSRAVLLVAASSHRLKERECFYDANLRGIFFLLFLSSSERTLLKMWATTLIKRERKAAFGVSSSCIPPTR